MGGWISLIGEVLDFDARLSKFTKLFSVAGVPDLRTEIHLDSCLMKTICWAWGNSKIPDVYVKKYDDFHIVLSGVITDLGHFRTFPVNQDQIVEKVLRLWVEHGEKIIDQINGSFSALFYNQKTKQVSIFTDRFASRSVWFGEERGLWIIGNFPSTIVAMRRHSLKLDPAGLWSLFHAGRQLGIQGIYANIYALLAGQKAILSPGNPAVITHWWKRKYRPHIGLSPREWGHRLSSAINNSAIRYKKVSKSPHLFLSGGLDSRIVATAVKAPLKTLSLCNKPNSETRIASMVSRSLGLEHHVIVRQRHWYFDTICASSLISSGVYLNHHIHFIVPVQRITNEDPEAEFLLGDLMENFNKHYFSVPVVQKLNFMPNNIENFLYTYVPYTIKDMNRIGKHFNHKLRKLIEKRYITKLKEYANSLMEVSEDHADRFDTFLRWANVGVTPTYNMITCIWPLAKERNLCFDNEINELSLQIPSEIRRAEVLHKWIMFHLNKILLLIPDANTFMSPIIPKGVNEIAKKIRPIIGRIQHGLIAAGSNKIVLKTSSSWLFLHEMYRKDQRYKEQIENLLFDKSVFPSELFDLEQIKKTWEEYSRGKISLHFEIEVLRSFGNLHKMIPCNGIDL